MNEVVKVSISGLSFTLERDAHIELEKYLGELEEFYGKESDGGEIISDIEERIAELFIERGGKVRIISITIVNDVIAVLGHPSEMEGDQDMGGKSAKNGIKPVKKLYRDLEDKVLGGVCSGFGAYWDVDPVLVRLVVVFLAFSSSILSWINIYIGESSFGVILLGYIILWAIMPAARTVEQKCAMRGKGAGVDEMYKDAKRGEQETRRNVKRDYGVIPEFIRVGLNVFGVGIGILLMIIGFAGFISGMALIFGISIAENISVLSIVDYIELGVENTLLLKLLAILTYSVPFLGMLYGGVMLCFKFKSPAWHPGLLMFLIWIVSFLGFLSMGIKSISPFMESTRWSDDRPILTNADTLYINMQPFEGIDGSNVLRHTHKSDIKADYIINSGKSNMEFVKYSKVKIIKHTPEENGEEYKPFVELKSRVCDGFGSYKLNNPTPAESLFSVKDSLVTLYPRIYSKENKFKGEQVAVCVHVPASMVVILQDERGKVKHYDK